MVAYCACDASADRMPARLRSSPDYKSNCQKDSGSTHCCKPLVVQTSALLPPSIHQESTTYEHFDRLTAKVGLAGLKEGMHVAPGLCRAREGTARGRGE